MLPFGGAIPDSIIPKPPGPLRRSARERRSPERYGQEGSERAYLVSTTTPSINDALAGPDSAAWTAAMAQEKAQLKKTGVHEELDTLQPGKQTVDTNWVLREKYDQSGKLEKRKARPTARGCHTSDYHRQQLELGEVTIEWRAGKCNKADLLTKALPAPTLNRAADAVMDGHEHLSKGE